ncbi:MAG: PhzF family phenazine biosynthesis protein [Gammaproteobacteria bacterium]|nr:PhzF family phenazine biosynthesis protein [Gammaproteobacteria bacterium]
MGKPKFFITDVFTTRKYGGNPLATFIDCESLSAQEMQQIAKEINFSETTFITARQPRNGGYDVRIFTPKSEVEFAGHPTLGTAHVIRNQVMQTRANDLVLNLPIGPVPVTFADATASATVVWMKQFAPKFGKQGDAAALARVLGIEPAALDMDFPIEEISTGFPHIVVPLKSLAALKRVTINTQHYRALVADAWAKIILVFSRESYEPGQSLSVRVFADFYGIPEDAATGSGNGALAAYLVRHNVLGSAQVDVLSGQGYEMGRPSTLALRAHANKTDIEVFVGGSVVDVAEGVWG